MPALPDTLMWRGIVDIIGFSSGELFTLFSLNVSLSAIHAYLSRVHLFLSRDQKRKTFPLYRSSFSQVTTGSHVGGHCQLTGFASTRFATTRMELISEQRHIKLSLSTLMPSIGVISFQGKVKVTLYHHDNAATLSGGCKSRSQL